MLFRLRITQTEEDYYAISKFFSLESSHAKARIRKFRIVFICIMAALLTVLHLLVRLAMPTLIFSVFYIAVALLLYKTFIRWSIKSQIKQMKKVGKLPFEPISEFEFYDDKFIEIAPTNRSEYVYSSIERVSIVGDRFIFLFTKAACGYMLPIPQIKEQTDLDAFIQFITKKCSNIEYV